jgi:hypothetical protein
MVCIKKRATSHPEEESNPQIETQESQIFRIIFELK